MFGHFVNIHVMHFQGRLHFEVVATGETREQHTSAQQGKKYHFHLNQNIRIKISFFHYFLDISTFFEIVISDICCTYHIGNSQKHFSNFESW